MRLRLFLLVLSVAAAGLVTTPSNAAGGQISVSLNKGLSAYIHSGSYDVQLSGAIKNFVGIPQLSDPEPLQFTDNFLCVQLEKRIHVSSYYWYTTAFSVGCGYVKITMDTQQNTARVTGKISGYGGGGTPGYYGRDTITVDVTMTADGDYLPFAETGRYERFAMSPNDVTPLATLQIGHDGLATTGLRRPAKATATIKSAKAGGFTKKRGSGDMYTGVVGVLDVYQ